MAQVTHCTATLLLVLSGDQQVLETGSAKPHILTTYLVTLGGLPTGVPFVTQHP